MSDELTAVVIVLAIGVAVAAVIFLFLRKRSAAVRGMLLPILTSAGWSDLRPMSLTTGLRGAWRSLAVELAYAGRQKSVPQRLILKVPARATSRLIVKRRVHGFLGRPFTLFGPPIVEVRHPLAQELWVRADEAALAERLFADEKAAALIANNLVAPFDEIRIGPKGLRIVRSLDDRPVRAKYNMPAFTWSFEPSCFEPIAREEVALSQALVDKLS